MTHPPQAPRRTRLDRLLRTASVVVPLGLLGNLALTLAKTGRGVWSALATFPLPSLALAVVLSLLPWLTNAWRIQLWTSFLGRPLAFRQALRIQLATEIGSAATPTASGGEFFKWAFYLRHGFSPGTAASLTALTVLEDTLFFALAIPTALALSDAGRLPVLRAIGREFRERTFVVVPLLLLGLSAVLLTVWATLRGAFGGRARRWSLRRLARARHRWRVFWRDAGDVYRELIARGKRRFALSFLLTAVQWSARYSVAAALLSYLRVPIDPLLSFVLQWTLFTLLNLVPTPGATGGAEAAFLLLYSPFVPRRLLGLATASWRFLTFYLPLGLGAALFWALSAAEEGRRGPPWRALSNASTNTSSAALRR